VEFPFKPVALINVSPLATHAHASLTETLTLMNARIVHEACVTIPVTRGDIDAMGSIANADIRNEVSTMLQTFVREIRRGAS
jgi:chromate reductase